MHFIAIPDHLTLLVTTATPAFVQLSEEEWMWRRVAGKWSRLEILGHLVDSAVNNHQRFVRAAIEGKLNWPGYDQKEHVRLQQYHQEPAAIVVSLWAALNRHIGHVLANIPASRRDAPCSIAGATPMPLSELAIDYVAHLEHHLRQITEGVDVEIVYSGLPWPAPQAAIR